MYIIGLELWKQSASVRDKRLRQIGALHVCNFMKRTHALNAHSAAGFSLVEVALAVAIAALGIITCLGLLPEGLQMSRNTNQMAIGRNIVEQVIRDLENVSNWSIIKPNSSAAKVYPSTGSSSGVLTFYYDDQGASVPNGNKTITFVAQADFGQPAYLPGVSGLQQCLARVVIRLANTTNASFTFDPSKPETYLTFTHLIARSQ